MPELPEVEIVKRSLDQKIQKKKIISINLRTLVFIIHQTYQKNITMLKYNLRI